LFGAAVESPQSESTPFYPRSPYGVAKLYGYWIVRNYRDAYSMHATNGILFNHESPRRGESFVTRKITYTLARLRTGRKDLLMLGDLDARRDWGYAADYVEGMWMMLQQDKPDDYVLATGETHNVREFVQLAASVAGFEIEWEGAGAAEKGRDRKTGQLLVGIDPRFLRPPETRQLVGDASKARRVLGWRPRTSFHQLVEMMMKSDLNLVGIGS
jgi:GDPmannose 4,6-dehydratase